MKDLIDRNAVRLIESDHDAYPQEWNDDYEKGFTDALNKVLALPPAEIKKELREAYAAGYTDAVQVMRERARAEEVLKLDACTSQPEIIACGDCKHWICHDRRCGYWNHGVKPLDWCCHAERREE